MALELLDMLCELPPAEARQRLLALARQQGPAALETLLAALQEPALAEAAVEALAEVSDQGAWDALEALARGSGGLRKAARRAQHRLRSRGFYPQAPSTPQERPAAEPERAEASIFDSDGAQLLRLVRAAPLGMVRSATLIVNSQGLVQCRYRLQGRAETDEELAEEDTLLGWPPVEMGLAYVARRVRQAVARSRQAGRSLPQDYVEAVRLLEGAPEDRLPEGLAAASSQAATLAEATSLVRHPTMAHWLAFSPELNRYAEEWLRIVRVQPLYTEEGLPNLAALRSRGQMTGRIIGDLCEADQQQRWAEQLAEQARLLWALGEPTLAQVAARCAAGLGQDPAENHPFVRALVEASMEVMVAAVQDEEDEEDEEDEAWAPMGGLWLPRPAPEDLPEDEPEKPAPRLWLPGQ